MKGKLDQFREEFRKAVQKNAAAGGDAAPCHPRFEVEDLQTRQNYTFVLADDNQSVTCYNTSRGAGRVKIFSFPDKGGAFPFGCSTAEVYFKMLFNKALNMEGNIAFLGYVDAQFRPIEEEL